MSFSNTTVVIPTLNEEKNIEKLISLLKRLYERIEIIVSDDGSQDKTQQIVKDTKEVRLIDRSKKKVKGLTASVIDGFKLAKGENIIVMDGDLQHPPEKIKEIIENLKNDEIVVASRENLPKDWPLTRKIISTLARLSGKFRLAKKSFKIKDIASGFFGVKKSLIDEVLKSDEDKFEKQGYKVLFDLLKYCPDNTKVGEVYYDFRLRNGGASKINKKHIWVYFKSLFK